MGTQTFKEGVYYKLINTETNEETIVYCYKNPDMNNELGFGFNTADGGGWMPTFDLSKNTKTQKLEFQDSVSN